MLKRISKIDNIGRFKSCASGKAQFEKITLIFGRNTYGKSTLGDLFSSIETGVLDSLKARRTIPSDNKPQTAILAFQPEGQKETPFTLPLATNSDWSHLPNGLRLHVFDDTFLHKNVFLGQLPTRDTKEKFSAFVLGSQGVEKARFIADKNKQKGDATRERSKLKKAVFSDFLDEKVLENFLALSLTEDETTLQEKVVELRSAYETLNKQRKNAAVIQAREILTPLSWGEDFQDALQRLNQSLKTSVQTHHEAAQKAVAAHIQKHFADTQNAESWVRQGVGQNNGTSCQFCGQTLNDEALHLLEAYRQYFDTSYRAHEQTVKQELTDTRALLTKDRISQLKIAIANNKSAFSSYSEMAEDSQYASLKEQLVSYSVDLTHAFDNWELSHKDFKAKIDAVIVQKQATPQTAFAELSADPLLSNYSRINELIAEYNAIAIKLNACFSEFKLSVSDTSLVPKLADIARSGKEEANKLNRLKLASQCSEYISLGSQVTNLDAEIVKLNKELNEEQSGFLKSFFTRMNAYFQDFGSRNFKLEQGSNNVGHQPIYYLKVKFHGVDIPESKLAQVFSESDRRALALAIFWAKIEGLDEAQKRNAIVVLDDPVTSFDNHRMTTVHQKIVELSDVVRQVILLSHFEHGVSSFLKTYRHKKEVKLLAIQNQAGTSTIEDSDVENFIKTEHEKARDRIFQFASGNTSVFHVSELRVFFEHEINLRFAEQIFSNQINEQNLSDRIDKLKNSGVITSEIAKTAHSWREMLNPEHHTWTGRDLEDQRLIANNLRQFIYHELIPTQS